MHKRKRRKHKVAKRKATLTKDFKAMEEEVHNITKKTVEAENDKSGVLKQIEFFTGCIEDSNEQLNIQQESSGKESNSSESPLEVPLQVASYVQIETSDPICPAQTVKVEYESTELFIPSSKEIAIIDDVEAQRSSVELEKDGFYVETAEDLKSRNRTRIVNRFYIKGDSNMILSSNHLKNEQNFCPNRYLYKSECEKAFEPIFYMAPAFEDQPSIVTHKKVLTISLKELRFLLHPLQREEHRIANKLEEFCDIYREIQSQNKVHKITAELSTVRQIITDLLDKSDEAEIDKLEGYLDHARNLRNNLHREELTHKNIINSALETWITLKNLRKKQGYNWTTIKLLIKTQETNVKEEEKIWNKRFHLELNEILREELSVYYREKRNRKEGKMSVLRKPDVEHIRADLRETLMKCSRLPTEPKVEIDANWPTIGTSKNLEKKRAYYFKIFLENELVESTKPLDLSVDFVLRIHKTFSILLEKRIPDSVKIEIYEVRKLPPDTKLADIFLPITSIINNTSGIEDYFDFASKNLQILGKLKISLYCTNLEPQQNEVDEDNLPKLKRRTEISRHIVKNWYENQLINPLNPDCLLLVKKLNENEETAEIVENDDTFVLDEQQLAFCSENEIENNQRLRLLSLRYKNDMKYKDFRFVPLFENEFATESEEKVIEEGNWMDPIDLQKHHGKKYLRTLYETVQNHCIQLSRTDNDASNLLIGNDPPTISSIISTILAFFGPSRPLKLKPPKTAQIPMQPTRFTNLNIVVNVVRATGVPVRNFSTTESTRRSSSASLTYHTLRYTNVNPYVSVSYKDKTIRTMSAEGSNPTWNEQLVIQISGNPNEFKDDIKFQLFDEYVEDLISDDTTRAMEVYQRIHTNWLGELRLPINAVLFRQSIEGIFELNSSKILLGYSNPSFEPADGAENSTEDIPEIRQVVYLSLYINIEPQFETARMSTSCLECSELKEVKTHIQKWCIQVKENFPERFIDPLISLANGKRVCITRLLEPIPLPVAESNENIEDYIRRYVSLMPVLKVMHACIGLNGIWLNNQVMLDTSWASPKDLGVLLTCFYLSVGIRAWLVLGIVFPYGESTATLIKEENNYIFVDPFSGKKYSTRDVFCPVVRVYYLIAQDNIYCNFQKETRVSMTDFNLDDSRNWIALFDKSNPAPIGGVHKLNYSYKPLLSILDLRKNIERKIMKKINSWRATRKTIWNRAFQSILYDILNDLEQDAINDDDKDSEEYLEKLTHAIPTYRLFGFTLNFSYTNLPSISDRIKSTGIHLNTDKNVEFSVAVHIYQYPNNILSIWVFLASAIPIL